MNQKRPRTFLQWMNGGRYVWWRWGIAYLIIVPSSVALYQLLGWVGVLLVVVPTIGYAALLCPERERKAYVGTLSDCDAARKMKVWPFGVALRGEASNHLMLRWLKTVVVSDEEKAPVRGVR